MVREHIVHVNIPQGALGAVGNIGNIGLVDNVGIPGPAGPVGPPGVAGPAGPAGPVGPAGAVGPAGPAGNVGTISIVDAVNAISAIGSVGAAGPVGATGVAGITGPVGATGSEGPAGATGPVGVTGDAGPAGGLSQFGYIYNLGAQVIQVEADVTFDTNGVLTPGFTHAPGTAHFVVANSGHYEVCFSVSGVEPNQFALFLNSSSLVAGSVHGSGTNTQVNIGQSIVALAAGDVLTLRNHSSATAVTLQTLDGGTQANVNASIIIKKLS